MIFAHLQESCMNFKQNLGKIFSKLLQYSYKKLKVRLYKNQFNYLAMIFAHLQELCMNFKQYVGF